jgi:hypothetical protein
MVGGNGVDSHSNAALGLEDFYFLSLWLIRVLSLSKKLRRFFFLSTDGEAGLSVLAFDGDAVLVAGVEVDPTPVVTMGWV